MKKGGLGLAGGDRAGEKELDSRHILVARADWTGVDMGFEGRKQIKDIS